MNDLSTISGALANSDLFKELQESTDKIAGGGGGGYKRLSIKGGKFRLIVDGDQVGKPKADGIHIVIVAVSEINKTYYGVQYDPNDPKPPICWSSDSRTPDASVPVDQRQSDACKTCPMAARGSGQGTTAACRYSQRLGVVLEDDLETVYQLQVPAKSLFGNAENGHMPMQAYGKMLKTRKIPVAAIVTEVYFDEDSETPKLFFKPVRGLTEDELQTAVNAGKSEEALKAITLTVSQTDGVQKPEVAEAKVPPEPAPKPKSKPRASSKPKPEVVEAEPIDEPVKVSRKKATPADIDEDLAEIIGDWD